MGHFGSNSGGKIKHYLILIFNDRTLRRHLIYVANPTQWIMIG